MAILDKIKKTVKREEKKEDKKPVVSGAGSKKSDLAKKSKNTADKKNSLYYNIILRPYITEKTSMMGQENKYVFVVSKDASKVDIKNAIENIFSVSVLKVSVVNVPSKKVRLGMHEGKKPGFKKAIVKLKEGDKIDIGI